MQENSNPQISDRKKRIYSGVNMNTYDAGIGKLPPQALDVEEAVLGALMLDRDSLANVIDSLKKDTFYRDEHQRIFSAIFELFASSKPVDILTVVQELKKRGELDIVGGIPYITSLTNRVGSTANIE
jgi:replicative DNA helicase